MPNLWELIRSTVSIPIYPTSSLAQTLANTSSDVVAINFKKSVVNILWCLYDNFLSFFNFLTYSTYSTYSTYFLVTSTSQLSTWLCGASYWLTIL